MEVEYREIVHFARKNFDDLVVAQSTRRTSSKSTDFYGRTTETTLFYRGSRILGKMIRHHCGCVYFIRSS